MSNKDWTGNKNSIYKTLGASAHTDKDREENDYYATDPIAIDVLFSVESFQGSIWECACGEGHLSKRMAENGKVVVSTDLIDRGFGIPGIDFLETNPAMGDNIITNPPYKYALEFAEHALDILEDGKKLALFLKLQFLEGKKRKQFFINYPPKKVYVSSSRILCAKNADFQGMKDGGGSAVAYAWYVWQKGYLGNTSLRWVN